ncbi:conserved membrane protein of unknown function [Tenacibaculum sp. 190524A02b]|uniref:DUF6326 family protein n=1 Tax=Tenacibaculum vairaonense TaxID=3137860 RepID=UPI0032B1CADB
MKKSNKNSTKLVDYKINIKLKLASLWTVMIFLYIYTDYFTLMMPGKIEAYMSQDLGIFKITPFILVIFALILIVPSLMIFLSLVLRPIINKWLNIVVAIVWSSMSFLILISDLFDGSLPWSAFYDLYQLVEIVIFIIIIRTSLKWPKEEGL